MMYSKTTPKALRNSTHKCLNGRYRVGSNRFLTDGAPIPFHSFRQCESYSFSGSADRVSRFVVETIEPYTDPGNANDGRNNNLPTG